MLLGEVVLFAPGHLQMQDMSKPYKSLTQSFYHHPDQLEGLAEEDIDVAFFFF